MILLVERALTDAKEPPGLTEEAQMRGDGTIASTGSTSLAANRLPRTSPFAQSETPGGGPRHGRWLSKPLPMKACFFGKIA